MSFRNWGFIYLGVGTEDPAKDRAVIEVGGLKTTIVAIPDKAQTVQAAIDLVEDGAQSIELCGAFGPIYAARVIEAVGDRVPVGHVSYSMESVHHLVRLFPQQPA